MPLMQFSMCRQILQLSQFVPCFPSHGLACSVCGHIRVLGLSSTKCHKCSIALVLLLLVEWDMFCLYSLVLGSCPLSQSGPYTQGSSNPPQTVTTGHAHTPHAFSTGLSHCPVPAHCELPTHPVFGGVATAAAVAGVAGTVLSAWKEQRTKVRSSLHCTAVIISVVCMCMCMCSMYVCVVCVWCLVCVCLYWLCLFLLLPQRSMGRLSMSRRSVLSLTISSGVLCAGPG